MVTNALTHTLDTPQTGDRAFDMPAAAASSHHDIAEKTDSLSSASLVPCYSNSSAGSRQAMHTPLSAMMNVMMTNSTECTLE